MPIRDLRQGADLAYANGLAFLKEAKLLANTESFGHAVALTMFAVEELAKAEILVRWSEGAQQISNYTGLLERREATHVRPDSAVLSHRTKYAQFLAYLILSEVVNSKRGFRYAFEHELVVYNYHEHAQARVLDSRRQDALYVDYAHGKWKSPRQFEPVAFVYMHSRARRYSRWVRQVLNDGYTETVRPLIRGLSSARGSGRSGQKRTG